MRICNHRRCLCLLCRVQPIYQSQWGRRYQEEELCSLRSELDTVSRDVEAETKQLRDREEVIRSIRDEQQQVLYTYTSMYRIYKHTYAPAEHLQ